MCYWRRVCNQYLICGHSYNLPDEMIQCDSRWCRFSSNHPGVCIDCMQTCWQYRQYPQQYAPQINNKCPACRDAADTSSSRYR